MARKDWQNARKTIEGKGKKPFRIVDPDLIWSAIDGEIRRYDSRQQHGLSRVSGKWKQCSECWHFIREMFATYWSDEIKDINTYELTFLWHRARTIPIVGVVPESGCLLYIDE